MLVTYTSLVVAIIAAMLATSCRLSDGPQSFVTSRSEEGVDLVFHIQWTESAAEDLTGSLSLAGSEGTEFQTAETGFTGTREGENINLTFDGGGFEGTSANGTIEGDTLTLRISGEGGDTLRMEAADREEFERLADELRSQAAGEQRSEDTERQAVEQAAAEAYAAIQALVEDPEAEPPDGVLGDGAREWAAGAFPAFPVTITNEDFEEETVGTARISDISGVRADDDYTLSTHGEGSYRVQVSIDGDAGVALAFPGADWLGPDRQESAYGQDALWMVMTREGGDWVAADVEVDEGSGSFFNLSDREEDLGLDEYDPTAFVESCGDDYEDC